MASDTLSVGWSLRTWEAILNMAFRLVLSLDMMGAGWYSVDAGFVRSGRSYGRCNMMDRSGRDVFLRDHTTSVRNLKRKMTSQTHDVIYQNDLQKVRNWSISHKNGVRVTWKKLWFLKDNRRELLIFCYKMGCVNTLPKLVLCITNPSTRSLVIKFFTIY